MQLPYLGVPVSAVTEPRYLDRDGSIHFGAGADSNVFMFKYPLAGDFSFSHRNVYHGWGGSHNLYGGTSYVTRSTDSNLTARAIGRNSVKFPTELIKKRVETRPTPSRGFREATAQRILTLSGDTYRARIDFALHDLE